MSRFYKFVLLVVLAAATLACGLTNTISQAQNLASTAESVATSMPIQTLEALPSSMPDVGNYLNPTGQPVSNWNNIPVMSQATAGQEFNKTTYSYKVPSSVAVADIQTYYTDQMKTLGWSSSFSAQGGSQGGVMLFTKGNSVLTVTITPTTDNTGSVVILLVQ
jgi:hypothetical protein